MSTDPGPIIDNQRMRVFLFRSLFWAIAGMAMVFPVRAAWDISPSFSTMASYSDNVTLAPKGLEEEDYVLGLRPAVTAQSNAAAVDVNLSWSMDAQFYKDDESRNRVTQSMFGSAASTLVQDLAFVTATAAIRRQLLDPQTTLGPADLSSSDAFGEVRTYTLSPYIAHALSNFARIKTGVNYEWVDVQRRYRDTRSQSWFADLASGPRFSQLTWDIAYTDTRIYYEGTAQDELHQNATLTVKDQFLPEWALIGTAGYTQNDYARNTTATHTPDGSVWLLALSWTPGPRFNMEAGGGEQFYGRTGYGKFNFRDRHFRLAGSYTEELTSYHKIQLEYASQATIDPTTGQPIFDVRYVVGSAEVFINKKSLIDIGFKATRADIGLQLFQDRRRLQDTGGTEVAAGATVSAHWNPTPRTGFDLRAGKQQIEFVDGRTDALTTAMITATHGVSPRLNTNLSLQRIARDTSSVTAYDYVNHMITLSATLQF